MCIIIVINILLSSERVAAVIQEVIVVEVAVLVATGTTTKTVAPVEAEAVAVV